MEALRGSGVKVASVATAFPSGRASLPVKLADTRDAVAAGADEIDMVIDRGAFLSGHYLEVFDEIVAVKEACGDGAPQGHPGDRRAGRPTTTSGAPPGWRCSPAATSSRPPPARSRRRRPCRSRWSCSRRCATSGTPPGRQVGVKPAGGIRTTKDAIKYLVLVNETVGDDWLDPDWFRLGASSLLNDLLMQRTKIATGRYSGPDYFTLD